jgi:glutamyl-tRNA reductase
MDLGMPRNVDPGAVDLYNFYLYNLDDLTEIVQQNRNARESEVPKAEVLVDEQVNKFLSWQASVELVDVVATLRTQVREQRAAFVRTRLDRLPQLSAEQREALEQLMDEMLEKLMLGPVERLRGERELRKKIQNVEAIRDLFLAPREKP